MRLGQRAVKPSGAWAWGIALALAGAVGGFGGVEAQGLPSSWTTPAAPVQIADDLYYVGTRGLAAFLFTSDEGHVLIDAPLAENAGLLLDNVRTLGFDPSEIRILLHSHAHFDHVGGFAAILEATGADLVVHEADAAFIERGTNFGLEDVAPDYAPADVARSVEHLETVRLGDLALTAHVTPGHTPGCTSWSGTVHLAGEPFEFVSVCSLTVLSQYTIVGPDATYPGHGADYCRSLAHLRSLAPDIFLAPHAGWFGMWDKKRAFDGGDARAFVDPESYRAYLDGAEAGLERALEEQGHVGGCATLTG